MPVFVRWYIKTALVHLILAFLAGGLAMYGIWHSGLLLPFDLTPVFYHLFMVGWVTQLIFGVSIWMFPSFSGDKRFGPEALIWGLYGTLNGGLLLRVIFEPMKDMLPGSAVSGYALVLSSILQVVAGGIYVYLIWPRVKGK